jgi:hypothetical protein
MQFKVVETRTLNMGTYIEMAYSEKKDTDTGSLFFSKRILERYPNGHPSKNANGTIWGKKETIGETGEYYFLPGVDDARLFEFEKNVYMYLQRYDPLKNDCNISILNLKSGIESNLISPTGFNGKNWIPLSFNNNLYFFYSIEPLLVFKAEKNGEIFSITESSSENVFSNLRWGDDANIFSAIRGGTPFENVGNEIYIAFTHITPSGSLKASHRIGALLLSKNGELRHLLLSRRVLPTHLFDPYGINCVISGDKNLIYVWTSYVVGDIHNLFGVSKSFLLEFNTDDLIKCILDKGTLIKGSFLEF